MLKCGNAKRDVRTYATVSDVAEFLSFPGIAMATLLPGLLAK